MVSEAKFMIITRPRRWGKTLNLDMIKTFLQIPLDENGQRKEINENIKLFTGGTIDGKVYKQLKIAEHKSFIEKEAAKWPVIFLSFSGLSDVNDEATMSGIKYNISRLYKNHSYLINHYSKIIKQNQSQRKVQRAEKKLKFFKQIYESVFPNYQILSQSLRFLTQQLQLYFNRKVIILVDQYDNVFNIAFRHLKDKNEIRQNKPIKIMSAILIRATKNNKAVERVIMVGILPLFKQNSYYGIDHFIQYGVLESGFAQYFGFTQSQVNQLLKQFKSILYQEKQYIKKWYKGYNIGKKIIFNPFSIMFCIDSFLQKDQNPIQAYWVNSGSTSILGDAFDKLKDTKQINQLINNGYCATQDQVMYNFDYGSSDMYLSLLMHTGYLTIANGQAGLRIPNFQIKITFYEILLQKLLNSLDPITLLDRTLEKFQNSKQYEKLINEKYLKNVDNGKKNESYFHCLLGGSFQFMSIIMKKQATHFVYSQVSNNNKKFDNLFAPVFSKSQTVIIHEYKINKDLDINKTVKRGLWQVYGNKFLQFALNRAQWQEHWQEHWKNFHVRIVVFHQSKTNQKWNVLIKQYKHNYAQAFELINIFMPFKDKRQRIDLLKQRKFKSIFKLIESQSIQQNVVKIQKSIQKKQSSSLAITPSEKLQQYHLSFRQKDKKQYFSSVRQKILKSNQDQDYDGDNDQDYDFDDDQDQDS